MRFRDRLYEVVEGIHDWLDHRMIVLSCHKFLISPFSLFGRYTVSFTQTLTWKVGEQPTPSSSPPSIHHHIEPKALKLPLFPLPKTSPLILSPLLLPTPFPFSIPSSSSTLATMATIHTYSTTSILTISSPCSSTNFPATPSRLPTHSSHSSSDILCRSLDAGLPNFFSLRSVASEPYVHHF